MTSNIATTTLSVETTDDRQLEVLAQGPPDGRPLLFHTGTPSGITSFPDVAAAATERGIRLISYSRPGYGESTPQPGRSVSDVTVDVVKILDHLGADQFLTLGWSGGGPHALACAALLPERCSAAGVLAGVAPYPADGLDWFDGMGEENHAEFGAALDGAEALSAYLDAARAELVDITAEQVGAALGGLAPPVDKAALTSGFAEALAASFRRAMLRGIDGWRDDDLAFTKPWGFALDSITVPVAIWQGGQDLMVPFAHGKWLAGSIPGAQVRLFDEEGHLSLIAQVGRIFDDLLDLAA